MVTIDIRSMETLYASRVRMSLEHIELIASSINSAVAGGSDNALSLIPDGDKTLARAVLGLAQASAEYDAMCNENEVMFA